MGQSADVFGYLRIGASTSEGAEVRDCIAFNREVINQADNSGFWTSREFRFSVDSDDVRSFQMISIVKVYTRLNVDDFQSLLVDFFSKLVWSDGYIVNRSIDRPLVGQPAVYEYDLDNPAFAIDQVEPVGDNLQLEVKVPAPVESKNTSVLKSDDERS